MNYELCSIKLNFISTFQKKYLNYIDSKLNFENLKIHKPLLLLRFVLNEIEGQK